MAHRQLAAFSAALSLIGCAGQVQTSYGDMTALYGRSTVQHAGAAGAFPLVVHGVPFPGVAARPAAEAVARRMRLPGWHPPVPFALAPVAGAPTGDWRLVLVFNPTRPVADACGDLRGIPLAPPRAEIQVKAAFCTGGEMVSEASGGAPSGGPDSPQFQQLLDQIAATVFPERNRLIEPDQPFLLRRRG